MQHVIIGNSAAAIGAIEGMRQVDRENRIVLISDEPYHTYGRPLISYYLAGKVPLEKMWYRPLDFYDNHRVETRLGHKAVAIDVDSRSVRLAGGEEIGFDRLLLATGGKPFVPPMAGLDKEGVFSFLKLDDVKALASACRPGKKAVIIGAGLIGLKAAEALEHLGLEVTVVELANRVLSTILDVEAAAMVQVHLEARGIRFILENTVVAVRGEDRVSGVLLRDGLELPADSLIIAIGVVPNHDLARGTGIAINRGIVVDERQETSVPGIYAAGDVAEGYDLLFGGRRVIPILPNAYRQGEVAGRNMAGAATTFPGGFAMNAIGFFDLPMITAGIVNPDGDEFEVMVEQDPAGKSYRKLVLRQDRLVGFIFINQIDRAGIYTGLLRDGIDVGSFKDKLLRPGFGYLHLPAELRRQRLAGGVA